MKMIFLSVLVSLMTGAAAMANAISYDCLCKSKKCSGSENLLLDVTSTSGLNVKVGDIEWEVSEEMYYSVDLSYNPRTRTGYVRYLPTEESRMYIEMPVLVLEKSLVLGQVDRRRTRSHVGTVYAQKSRNGFHEAEYSCSVARR